MEIALRTGPRPAGVDRAAPPRCWLGAGALGRLRRGLGHWRLLRLRVAGERLRVEALGRLRGGCDCGGHRPTSSFCLSAIFSTSLFKDWIGLEALAAAPAVGAQGLRSRPPAISWLTGRTRSRSSRPLPTSLWSSRSSSPSPAGPTPRGSSWNSSHRRDCAGRPFRGARKSRFLLLVCLLFLAALGPQTFGNPEQLRLRCGENIVKCAAKLLVNNCP